MRSIFAQTGANTVHQQYRRIVEQLDTRFPQAAALLEEAAQEHDEWAVARRSMRAESIAKALADPVAEPQEVIAIEAAG